MHHISNKKIRKKYSATHYWKKKIKNPFKLLVGKIQIAIRYLRDKDSNGIIFTVQKFEGNSWN